MPGLRSIVVGIDFSPCSAAALLEGVRLADRARGGEAARLLLLHVVQARVVAELAESLGQPAEAIRERVLADATGELAEFVRGIVGDRAIDQRVVVGDPAAELAAACERAAADLLILGVHGQSGPGEGAGSLALGMVRGAGCPVMLVQESLRGSASKILACVDFSPASLRALELAARVARADQAALRAIHAHYPAWRVLHYAAPSPEAPPEYRKQYYDRLDGMLRGALEEHAEVLRGVDCSRALVEEQSPSRAIVDEAQRSGADLVVLGAGDHGLLRRIFVGSTAERILRRLDLSLLVVPARAAG